MIPSISLFRFVGIPLGCLLGWILLAGCGREVQKPKESAVARPAESPPAGQAEPVQTFPQLPPWENREEVATEITRLKESLSEDEARLAIRDLLFNLAFFRPELAAPFLSEIQSGDDRERFLGMLVARWGEIDPEKLFRWGQDSLTGSEQMRVSRDALEALAKADPVAAATLVDELPFSEARLYAVTDIAHTWAVIDLSRAYEWVAGLTDDEEREWGLSTLSRALARERPDLARTLMESEESSGVREAMARALAGEQSESDSALDFVRSLPSELQAAASDEIAQRLSRRDPELALKYLEGADDAQMEIAGLRWAWTEILQRDPARAAASFSEFDSQEGVKEEMAPWLATMWYNVDSEGASRWVSELPDGEMRDLAIEGLVRALRFEDPDMADAWANDIADETRRQAVLQSLSYDRIVPRIE